MSGALSHGYAAGVCIGQSIAWINTINFDMKHATGAGSIVRPFDL